MDALNPKSLLVSSSGGVIDYVTPDGEILLSVAVPAGRVAAREYLELCPDGALLEISSGLFVVPPRQWAGVQTYGDGSHDTGANPDFAPTSASRMEREMRVTLSRLQAHTQRLDAREKALASIERVPTAPASSDAVLEPLLPAVPEAAAGA